MNAIQEGETPNKAENFLKKHEYQHIEKVLAIISNMGFKESLNKQSDSQKTIEFQIVQVC